MTQGTEISKQMGKSAYENFRKNPEALAKYTKTIDDLVKKRQEDLRNCRDKSNPRKLQAGNVRSESGASIIATESNTNYLVCKVYENLLAEALRAQQRILHERVGICHECGEPEITIVQINQNPTAILCSDCVEYTERRDQINAAPRHGCFA